MARASHNYAPLTVTAPRTTSFKRGLSRRCWSTTTPWLTILFLSLCAPFRKMRVISVLLVTAGLAVAQEISSNDGALNVETENGTLLVVQKNVPRRATP